MKERKNMASKLPIGVIALLPDPNDPHRGTIEFTSLQDPNEPPETAKLTAPPKQWVVWLIENYFDDHDIEVTLTFPWPDGRKDTPFRKNEHDEKVKDWSDDDGPGVGSIRLKVQDDAAEKAYKYTISTDLDGIPPLDPMLEVDDGGTIIPK